jgi:capsular exopolysaccharide synthesis family protein
MNEHPEAAEPEPFEPAQAQSSFSLFRVAWRYKFLLLLGGAVGVVLGGLYYARATPLYQSSVQVMVVKKASARNLVGQNDTEMYDDYLSTHQILIKSPKIVGQAVEDGKLASLPSFAGMRNPTMAVIGGLKVEREGNSSSATSILNITYRGPVAADCPKVLNAVVKSYQKFLRETYREVSSKTERLIKSATEILGKKMTALEEEHANLLRKHPNLVYRTKDGKSATQEQLFKIEARRASLVLKHAELKKELDTFQKAIREGRNREELEQMVKVTSSGVRRDSDPLAPLDERLAELKEKRDSLLVDFGSDHPKVRTLNQKIANLRSRMRRLAKLTPRGKERDSIEYHRKALQLEMEKAEATAEAMTELLKDKQAKLEENRRYEIRYDNLQREKDRTAKILDAISDRLKEVSLLKDGGGYIAEDIRPPGFGYKVVPRKIPIFMAGGILGLVLGLGLGFLAELSDQSFRTPEEIRRRLGLPVVGHIPYYAPPDHEDAPEGQEKPLIDPILCTVYRPRSREAERFRDVRTSLYFSTRGKGHKVIQVTSPDMGDGKTTLAANLAVSIAQSGKKAIIIDADFRRPRVHKLFGLSPARGLASVISGESELADVIHESGVENLAVLPCGPTPDNPAELLTLPRFKELLDYIRERYDFVLLDTPPLLVVSDPCVVVPQVDGVLLTIRLSKSARPHALRAKEILATLGANVVGVVVNGIGRNPGTGYGYTYGYGYGYGYGYKYGNYNYQYYNREGDYYEEDDGQEPGEREGSDPGRGRRRRQSQRPQKSRGLLGWLFKR